jgi:hypothetical protein
VDQCQRIFEIAQTVANRFPEFHRSKGASLSSKVRAAFLQRLEKEVQKELRDVLVEEPISTSKHTTFNFYLPETATAIEIALPLWESDSEFERDLFKCLLAGEEGKPVDRLVFIGCQGTRETTTLPCRQAILQYVEERYGLAVSMMELSAVTAA